MNCGRSISSSEIRRGLRLLDAAARLPDNARAMPPASSTATARLIAADWGTSRLRARLLDADGVVIASAESGDGIGQIDGGHEAAFERLIAPWSIGDRTPAIMAGMIGSRQGWHEAAYIPCPVSPQSLGANLLRFNGSGGRPFAIVPGVRLDVPSRDGDVMRGEETQMIGVIDREPGFTGTAILPGTHSKWVRIEDGVIVDFQTFITGELFELLAHKSFLRHSVAEGGGDPAETPEFALAVERVAGDRLPFLNALFSVRARQLLLDVDRQANLAYLSGIAIAGEIAAALTVQPLQPGRAIRIIASATLARAYRKALVILGYESEALDGDRLVLDGLSHLARATGLLAEK
jgi:2-dehydro-3-deoxygalactonokinase